MLKIRAVNSGHPTEVSVAGVPALMERIVKAQFVRQGEEEPWRYENRVTFRGREGGAPMTISRQGDTLEVYSGGDCARELAVALHVGLISVEELADGIGSAGLEGDLDL